VRRVKKNDQSGYLVIVNLVCQKHCYDDSTRVGYFFSALPDIPIL
jgi:hypothetical protein